MLRWILLGLLLMIGPLRAANLSPCLDCHRSAATAGLAPALDGQHRDYLQTQLTRFREHMRPAFPMVDLAQGLDDPLIAELATAFAERAWQPYSGRIDPNAAKRGGESAAGRDCRACHGDAMKGGGDIPRLAGQAQPYLRQQLLQFVQGERHHPPTGGGQHMHTLKEDEAEALSHWLSSLRD